MLQHEICGLHLTFDEDGAQQSEGQRVRLGQSARFHDHLVHVRASFIEIAETKEHT
jgi:hypothetical protein